MKAEVRFYYLRVTQGLTVWLVGKVVHQTGLSVDALLNSRFGTTPPTLSLIPTEEIVPGHTQGSTANEGYSTEVQEVIVRRREGVLNRRGPFADGKPILVLF